MDGPNPAIKHPVPQHARVGFLKPLVTAPNIEIGDFTYYDDPDGPDKFAEKCVLHHYRSSATGWSSASSAPSLKARGSS